jgi:hypothetical protein
MGRCHGCVRREKTIMKAEERRRKLPLWCSLVDSSVRSAAACGEPFTIETVLDSIGIFRLIRYRERTLKYARKILAASS